MSVLFLARALLGWFCRSGVNGAGSRSICRRALQYDAISEVVAMDGRNRKLPTHRKL